MSPLKAVGMSLVMILVSLTEAGFAVTGVLFHGQYFGEIICLAYLAYWAYNVGKGVGRNKAMKDLDATPLQQAKEMAVQYRGARPPGSWRSTMHALATGLMMMVAWSSWTSVEIASIAGVVTLVVTVLLQGWLWSVRDLIAQARLVQLLKENQSR